MWSDWGDVVCARFSRGMDFLVGTSPIQAIGGRCWLVYNGRRSARRRRWMEGQGAKKQVPVGRRLRTGNLHVIHLLLYGTLLYTAIVHCTCLGLSYSQHAPQAIPVVEFTPLHNLLSRQPRKLLISVCILRQVCLSGHDSRFHEKGLDPKFFPLKGETTRADKLVG